MHGFVEFYVNFSSKGRTFINVGIGLRFDADFQKALIHSIKPKKGVVKKELRIVLINIILILSVSHYHAQAAFPYDALNLDEGAFNTTLSINVSAGVSLFNNLLLGSNVDFNTSVARTQLSWAPLLSHTGVVINGNAINQGFNSVEGQEFIANNDPVVLRFPQGVFANTYNWERLLDNAGNELAAADSRHITDPFIIGTRLISKHDSPKSVRIGYPSLKTIFDTADDNGKPLDLLTVLSVIINDADSNGRRWQKMIADGHNVRDMELGNEFFFRSQRSGTINTEAQWVERARAIVGNIKDRAAGLNRSVRFGIPISYRGGDPTVTQSTRNFHQNYNDLITVDESFFDAIVVHRYVSTQRDEGNLPQDLTDESLRTVLSASNTMDASLTYCKTQVSEAKNSIWLTEWGVSASEGGKIAASFLGAADVYSHIITNNERLEVERINWFSTVGANAQYTLAGTRNNIQLGTTGYGDVYKILRDNLRDAEMFNDVLFTSPNLMLNGEVQDGKAIHALAVKRADDTPRLIVTNKTNATARIFMDIDGERESVVNYRVNGFRWETLTSINSIPYSNEEMNAGAILIPPFSIVKVDMSFGEGVAILSTNGIDTKKVKSSFTLWPNPATSKINIELNNANSTNIDIYNMFGERVFKTKVSKGESQLYIKDILKPGLYLVVAVDDNKATSVKKLVVN